MWPIRNFDRRIPLAPTIIALALITLLVLTNLYGPTTDAQGHRGGAKPTPMDIPPQLPAQDAAPTQNDGAVPPNWPPPTPTVPADTAPVPQPTVTVTTTVTAPPVTVQPTQGAPGENRPATSPDASAAAPTGGGATPGPGPPGGGATIPPPGERLKVTDIRLNSDRANGARVRCDGLSEVVVAGTVLVDGGAGDVVYQWVFDDVWVWPADHLSFTGTGERQKTLSVPWRVPLKALRTVIKGSLQLRILQPVASAQWENLTVNFVCL